MDGPRAPLREELPQILDFLKNKLRKGHEWTLDEEYPSAFSPSNCHNLCIITEKDKILSHAVIKPIIIKSPLAIYKAAPIGSVVTDEAHRNQGLSGQILRECLQRAEQQECDFAILWTNLFDFYRKMGFELAGSELSYVLNRDSLPAKTPTDFRIVEGNNIDPQALLRLYSQHSVASVRTAEDIRKSLRIPNTRVYTAWSPSGALAAFAIEGKGADLSGYIHEWGGQVPALLNTLSHIVHSKETEITLIVPEHSKKLRRELQAISIKEHHGYLGMIKILRPQSMAEKAQKAAAMLGLNDLKINWVENELQLTLAGEQAAIKEERVMTQLFFGPEKPSRLFKTPGQLSQSLDKLFPLPLWIWGWDSI